MVYSWKLVSVRAQISTSTSINAIKAISANTNLHLLH